MKRLFTWLKTPFFRVTSFVMGAVFAAGLVTMFTVKAVDYMGLDGTDAFELGPIADTVAENANLSNNVANIPDWVELFDANGELIDSDGNGTPDAIEVFGGSVAAFVNDRLSSNSLSGSEDTTGFAGRNKNNDPIETGSPPWQWDTENHPPKDDLFNVYSYAKVVDDELIIYAALERITNEGASHIDFEFNQAGIQLDNTPPCGTDESGGVDDTEPCEFIGDKQENDLLVVMDFERGGDLGSVEVRRWSAADDEWVSVSGGELGEEGCNPDDTVCAFNNHANIASGPWETRGKNGALVTILEPNTFTEVGINVTRLFNVTPCFNSINAKSRTSPSFNSELKDFALGDFNLCRATVETEVHKVVDGAHVDITGGNVPYGTAVHDWAKVTGEGLPAALLPVPNGDFLFELISDGQCTRGENDANVVDDWTIPASSIGGGMAVADMLDDLGVEIDDLLPGDYGFAVTYKNDTHYRNITQEGCEPFTVDKIDTVTTTQIHANSDHDTDVQDTTLKVGNYVHDEVTITPQGVGTLPAPTGNLYMIRYSGDECTGDSVSDTIILTAADNGVADNVLEVLVDSIPDSVAYVSYHAEYEGDGIYNGSVEDCEVVDFEKYATRVVTEVRDTSGQDITGTDVFVGEEVHDWAQVSLAEPYDSAIAQPAFGGTLDFMIFAGTPACTNEAGSDPDGNSYPMMKTPGGDGSASTEAFAMIMDTISWVVTYTGDGFYEGDNIPEPVCEDITGLDIPTLIRTEIHEQGIHNADIQIGVGSGSVPVGTYVHDLANVSADPLAGPFPITDDPEGLVEFALFDGLGCSGTPVREWTSAAGTARPLGEDRVGADNTAEAETDDVQMMARGYVSFTARYLGEIGIYEATALSTEDCEELEVTPLTPRIRTEIHLGTDHTTDVQIGVGVGEVNAGSSIHDKAFVEGDFGTPTGDVIFYRYDNLTCEAPYAQMHTLALLADGTVETPDFITSAGDLSYKAVYVGYDLDGDGTYDGDSVYTPSDDSDCEKLVVIGGEGCTPGYWRNHLERWAETAYSPGDDFDTTFSDADILDMFDPNLTLGYVIDHPQDVPQVAFHGVAALLSADHPDVGYPYTVEQVINLVQAGDLDALKTANELGCPIN